MTTNFDELFELAVRGAGAEMAVLPTDVGRVTDRWCLKPPLTLALALALALALINPNPWAPLRSTPNPHPNPDQVPQATRDGVASGLDRTDQGRLRELQQGAGGEPGCVAGAAAHAARPLRGLQHARRELVPHR